MVGVPAFVRNGRLDILAINDLGRALYSEAFSPGRTVMNLARFQFLNSRSHNLYPDRDNAADTAVAILRTEAGRDPFDKCAHRPRRRAVDPLGRVQDPLGQHDVRLHRGGPLVLDAAHGSSLGWRFRSSTEQDVGEAGKLLLCVSNITSRYEHGIYGYMPIRT